MPNFIKFLMLAIPVLGVGAFMGYNDYMKPVGFSAQGTVTAINWKSRNHGMPVIDIVGNNGVTMQFSSNRITLESSQLKVGDSFKKVSSSKLCQINKNIVQCVN